MTAERRPRPPVPSLARMKPRRTRGGDEEPVASGRAGEFEEIERADEDAEGE